MDASKREYRERLDLKRAEERVIIEVWWESRRVRYLGKYTRPSCVPTKRKWFTSDADVFFPLWRLVSGASFPKFWMRLTGPCVFLKWSMYRFVLGRLVFSRLTKPQRKKKIMTKCVCCAICLDPNESCPIFQWICAVFTFIETSNVKSQG